MDEKMSLLLSNLRTSDVKALKLLFEGAVKLFLRFRGTARGRVAQSGIRSKGVGARRVANVGAWSIKQG